MSDGLYQVETRRFVAGFVVREGKIIACSPILRRNLHKWMTIALKVADIRSSRSWSPSFCSWS